MALQDHGKKQPKKVAKGHTQKEDVPMPGVKSEPGKDGGGIEKKKNAEDQVENKNRASPCQEIPRSTILKIAKDPSRRS